MHVYIGVGTREARGLCHPRFYNFFIGIRFLLYKSTLLSLPPDFIAFLHYYMYMIKTNTAHNVTYIVIAF